MLGSKEIWRSKQLVKAIYRPVARCRKCHDQMTYSIFNKIDDSVWPDSFCVYSHLAANFSPLLLEVLAFIASRPANW